MIASLELPELLGVCDRIVVMYEGRIMAEVSAAQASEEDLAYWASGTHQMRRMLTPHGSH